MRGWIGTTDKRWFDFLRQESALRGGLDEVNFWRPSGRTAFKAIAPGAPFFFKLKAPHHRIGGFGIFARYAPLPDWMAWETFDRLNGAPDYATFRGLLGRYRSGDRHGAALVKVGCIVVTQPVFFDDDLWVDEPHDWKRNIVSGKSLDVRVGEGRRIYDACMERAAAARSGGLVIGDAPARYGEPRLVLPRLGQGAFRVAVTQAYDGACAVTTEHSLPALEAAHIRPFAAQGPHEVNNGLLLRRDIHRLFDVGYVTVTPDLRFEVSRRLKDDYGNGRAYDAHHGKRIQAPTSADLRPDPEALRWHNESIYRG